MTHRTRTTPHRQAVSPDATNARATKGATRSDATVVATKTNLTAARARGTADRARRALHQFEAARRHDLARLLTEFHGETGRAAAWALHLALARSPVPTPGALSIARDIVTHLADRDRCREALALLGHPADVLTRKMALAETLHTELSGSLSAVQSWGHESL